jgi:drug/metabolite transporter (DMT)-like permease
VALLPLAAPWSAPWHELTEDIPPGSGTAPAWLLATSVVLVSTVLAYLAGAAAVQRLSAPAAAALAYVEPAAATVLAWLALGERLAAPQLVGGLIVLTGAFLAQHGVSSTSASTSASTPVSTIEDTTALPVIEYCFSNSAPSVEEAVSGVSGCGYAG